MTGVVLVLGEEPFLQRAEVSELLAQHADLELSRFRGDDTPLARILDEVKTRTLFGGGRAVVVEGAAPLLEGDSLRAIAHYAASPAPGALLVLVAAKLDGRLKGSKELRSASKVIECAPLPDWKVAEWILRHASQTHRLSVDREAAALLKECVGEDLGSLDGALARLAEQIAPRTRLTAGDVADSTEDHRSPILFEAANALESADLPTALRAVGAAFDEGIRIRQNTVTDPGGIAPILLGQLHSAYVKLLRYHIFRTQGLDETEAAKRVGISPKATRFFLDRARHHRLGRLIERHELFLAAELDFKRGGSTPRQAVERLLIGILGSPEAPRRGSGGAA